MIPDYEREEVEQLRTRMGGEGEQLTPETIHEYWGEFSGDMFASWLIVDDFTFGNFAAWLIHKVERNKALTEK